MKVGKNSKQLIHAAVKARDANGLIDPTGSSVSFAFLVPGDSPAVGTVWTLGSWETITLAKGPQYRAKCLIGPGGSITLSVGSYAVWLKIDYAPELLQIEVDERLLIY